MIAYETDPRLIGQLLANIGYSVTFVDLTRNWDRIQLTRSAWASWPTTSGTRAQQVRPLKLMGASMGGLIVTTAAVIKDRADVLDLPQPSWSFEVDHVTTLDAPRERASTSRRRSITCFERFDHLDHEAAARTCPTADHERRVPEMVPASRSTTWEDDA